MARRVRLTIYCLPMQNSDVNPTVGSGPSAGRAAVIGMVFGMAVAALLIPPLVFAGVGLAEGMGIAGTSSALAEQYSTRRQNLAILGAVGVIPIALLGLLAWVLGKTERFRAKRRNLTLGGGLAILAVIGWVNVSYWPTFLPDKTYAGFPHGLEFVIGPLMFAPVAMLLGMLIGGLVSK